MQEYSRTMKFVSWGLLLVIVGLFLAVQIRIHRDLCSEPDVRAYQFLAKRLATGGPLAVEDKDPFLHQDHAWVETADGKLVPKFPPGYPLLMVPFYWAAGDDGMVWVSPLLGALMLLGAFALFREWMSHGAALIATAVLGLDSFVTFFSNYQLSHSADLCVVVWGMACLWRWLKRCHVGWGVVAGVLLGFAVMVRPANVLLGLPLTFVWCRHAWLGWRGGNTGRKVWKELGLVASGYLLMFVLLGVYQWAAFGNPLTSGYSLSGENRALEWSFLSQRFPKYIEAFYCFVGVPFVLGGLGLFLFGSGADRLLRVLWVAPFLLFYGCYYWDAFRSHWLLRFLLVTFPVFYGSMVGWVDRSSGRWGKQGVFIFLLVLPFLLAMQLNREQLDLVATLRKPLARENVWRTPVEAVLQPNAVIFTDEGGKGALDGRKEFRVYNVAAFHTHYDATGMGTNLNYNPKFQIKRQQAIEAFYQASTAEGLLELKQQRVRDSLAQGRQVVYMLSSRQIERERKDLPSDMKFQPMQPQSLCIKQGRWSLFEAVRL